MVKSSVSILRRRCGLRRLPASQSIPNGIPEGQTPRKIRVYEELDDGIAEVLFPAMLPEDPHVLDVYTHTACLDQGQAQDRLVHDGRIAIKIWLDLRGSSCGAGSSASSLTAVLIEVPRRTDYTIVSSASPHRPGVR